MNHSKLDFSRFYPEVFQAVPGKDYIVYAYMNDGSVHEFDVKPLIEKGGVFQKLKDEALFRRALTVLNSTVAWDIDGNRDEGNCIDIDPFTIFESPTVPDFPS